MKRKQILMSTILMSGFIQFPSILLSSCSCGGNIQIDCDDHIKCLDVKIQENNMVIYFETINIPHVSGFNFAYVLDKNNSYIKVNGLKHTVKDLLVDNIENTITFNSQKDIKGSIKINLTSSNLENVCNEYFDTYNKDFFDKITYSPHKYMPSDFEDFYCNSEAEAIFNWSWYPGYGAWNHLLHDGRGDTSSLDNETIVISQATPWTQDKLPIDEIKGNIYLKHWRYLNNALLKSTTSTRLTLYHGLEPDESDFLDFFKETTGLDISLNALEFRKKFDKNKLFQKSYIDYGFLATSFDLETPRNWARSSSDQNSIIFVLNVDPDVYGAYVSYTNRMFFDGFYIANPCEYQLLLNRKTNITFTDAKLYENGDKNIIYLFADVHKQTNLSELEII